MELEDLFDIKFEVIISRYIESSDAQSDTQLLNGILMQFQLNDIKILDFFLELQYYFTNGREQTRKKAVQLVYEVFQRYTQLDLTKTDFFALYEFFAKKILDVAMIGQAIKIINKLFEIYCNSPKQIKEENKNNNMEIEENKSASHQLFQNKENSKQIFEIFYEVISNEKLCISQYTQEVRLSFYTYILQFITHNNNEMRHNCLQKGDKFVQSIINIVEDEKDPRNIIFSFKLFNYILENFNDDNLQTDLKDEIFENLECYFPIEIKNSVNDQLIKKNKGKTVSQEEVQGILEDCLINKHFLKTTIGFLTEKLSSEANATLEATFNTLNKIFKKYNFSYFSSSELTSIQQNITIINYDTANKELFDAHIQTLYSFVMFLLSDVDNNILPFENLKMLTNIINYYFQIVTSESTSEDSRKSLKILQAISECSKVSNSMILSNYCKLFVLKYSNKNKEDALFWLENLLYFLQSSKNVSIKSNPLQKVSLNLEISEENKLKMTIYEAFNSTELQFIKIMCLKLLMLLNQYSSGDIKYEQTILDLIPQYFSVEEQIKTHIYDQQYNKCLLDFGSQILTHPKINNTKIIEFSHEKYIELFDENILPKEDQEIDLILYGMQKITFFSLEYTKKTIEFLCSKLNQVYYQDLCEKVQSSIVDMLQLVCNINRKNNSGYNIPTENILEIFNIYINNLQSKQIDLGFGKNRKLIPRILQNIMTHEDFPEQEKNKIFEHIVEIFSVKVKHLVAYVKIIKHSEIIFGKQKQQQLLELLQQPMQEKISKNRLVLEKLAHFYGNQIPKDDKIINSISFNQFNLKEPLNYKLFMGSLYRNSVKSIKILKELVTESTKQGKESDKYYHIFQSIFVMCQKRKSYLMYATTFQQQIYNVIFFPFNKNTCNKVAVINRFYPQGQDQFLNGQNQIQQRLRRTNSEPIVVEHKSQFVKKIKLMCLYYTPFNLLKQQTKLITPLILDFFKNSSDPQQLILVVKLLKNMLEINLQLFEGSYRILLEGILRVLTLNKLQSNLEVMMSSLLCLVECLQVPFPVFMEYKEQILNVLEGLLDHRKRLVRNYAVFVTNHIHTTM